MSNVTPSGNGPWFLTVDPDTYLPPDQTVEALRDEIGGRMGGAGVSLNQVDTELMQPHIASPEPHPAYDDVQDLAMLFNTNLI